MGYKATIVSFLILFSVQSFAGSNFPKNPDEKLTPGSLCHNPTGHRYPEHIPYCARNVKSGEKWEVIEDYNQLGYRIDRGNRSQFKIDHLIPLCAGGSNNSDNLWPQHESIYNLTDPLEAPLCDKMAQGRLLQDRAVELILRAKHNLNEVPEILELIENL